MTADTAIGNPLAAVLGVTTTDRIRCQAVHPDAAARHADRDAQVLTDRSR